ncbi:MAG: hypothetical protein HQP61_02385 [Peptococcaceae bacterium]|nr:hypothetical protein [Candidatus Syntrophopropionicum ammoniitolerans]
MHIYRHPLLEPPRRLQPGTVVEHKSLPGVPLKIVSGPEQGLSGELYRVLWEGREVQVKKCNLVYQRGVMDMKINKSNENLKRTIDTLEARRDLFQQKINDITNKITDLREQIAALEDSRQETRAGLQGIIKSIEVGTESLHNLQEKEDVAL